jgi:hypothetical protein
MSQPITEDARGDFIGDTLSLKSIPDFKTWDELENYMWNRHACFEAIDAGRLVWRDYQRAKKKPVSRSSKLTGY